MGQRRNFESIEFGNVLDEVSRFYRAIVNSFDISLDTKCSQKIVYTMKQIDLESIIINMITNAFEPVKGKQIRQIKIYIEQSFSHIILSFEDSGNGGSKGERKGYIQTI